MGLQAKLLHVLREGYFVRPGGESRIEMDVRILAATQVNLEQAMADRKLREDLYYRLSAFTVHVPALRQRKEEIPLLLGHFMNRLARRYNLPTADFFRRRAGSLSTPFLAGKSKRTGKIREALLGDGRRRGWRWAHSIPTATWRSGTRICPAPAEKSGWMFEAAEHVNPVFPA